MPAPKVSATGAKIEFRNCSPTIYPVFSQRTFEEVALAAVMAGKGNNRVLLFDIKLLICPRVGDGIGEFQGGILCIVSNSYCIADAVLFLAP